MRAQRKEYLTTEAIMKKPLYILPHGIEVIGEYAPFGSNMYWRVRIKAHELFDAKIVSGGMYIRRNRVVMTSILGRMLKSNEHVHHINEDKGDDSPRNLELITADEHNKHHKIGTKHTDESKEKTSNSVKKAYAEGRMNQKILKGTEQCQAKLDDEKVRLIRTSNRSAYSLAKELGVSKQVVLSARNNKTWKHV
jgi:hypothetical protein